MKHIKGLDTMRAIAALIVVFGHIELAKSRYLNIEVYNDYFPSGRLSVILFFVLSGFLISYLLIKEFEVTKTISFKRFYLRRILRILPLYYLVLLLSAVLISANPSSLSYFLCFTIFPNIAHAIGEGWSSSPQVWSIGVEEQFYLIWPICLYIIMRINPKSLTYLLLIFIVGFTVLPHFLGFLKLRDFHYEVMTTFEKIISATKYNCIAIGVFIGVAYAKRKHWINVFNNNYVFVFISLITSLMWFLRLEFKYFNDEGFALLFAFLILSIIGPKTYDIDSSITRFLGQISYGIYMYHWIIILLIINYIPYNGDVLVYNIQLYGATFGITIFISWLSYNLFEKRFINLKQKNSFKTTSKNNF